MDEPRELSLAEIRRYMLDNNCKVTNHALVKYFKQFLTNPQTQNESRKQFKSYVNVLATIKVENNQKFLILRKKYFHECPTEESILQTSLENIPLSPGCTSVSSESFSSPFRQPPPYKPPPEVTPSPKLAGKTSLPTVTTTGVTVESESAENYRDCINEFTAAVRLIDGSRDASSGSINDDVGSVSVDQAPTKTIRHPEVPSDNNGENKENIARYSFSSDSTSSTATMLSTPSNDADSNDNPISVKEATKKFNRMASEEEAKIISPPGKKKSEKQFIEEKMTPEVTLAHPKAKEWIVSMAKANYQELAKLASEYQELIKLQDPTTTALHWAAKHGNEDVVKLIAGTYKADVNARTNGGYTPLHLAMQFGRDNIFELLCNVYKANRDLMDWSGNKPLDYRKQRTSVSASTYSKIKARRKHSEKDLGFLRIGSLNVRVKKTTEAFSNFLGVGNGNGNTNVNYHYQPTAAAAAATTAANHHHLHHHRHHYHRAGTMRNPSVVTRTTKRQPLGMTPATTMLAHPNQLGSRASVPINIANKYDKIHKTWGSADNIPHSGSGGGGSVDCDTKNAMPPPSMDAMKRRNKTTKRSSGGTAATTGDRDSISSSNSSSNLYSGYSSMPTTPNQLRAPIGMLSEHHTDNIGDSDSDSACGFGSNWSVSGRSSSISSANMPTPRYG